MNDTQLLYMTDMQLLKCEAYVDDIEQKDGKTIVILDKTVFYPQGGGQPYDTGSISSGTAGFKVMEVRYADGKVQHIGQLTHGRLMKDDTVQCRVDVDRRSLNTRLHSGGHLLDMAVNELGYEWKPGKGYHFPDGPYVEYEANLSGDEDEGTIDAINGKMQEILSRNIVTGIKFVNREEMTQLCRNVPDNIPKDKPSRVVLYGGFGIPCGGTHVSELKDIGSIRVRKIKTRPGLTRVSYEVL